MNPGITTQSVASIVRSAARPEAPTSAIFPSISNSSPETMEFEASIVTSVPFFMSIEATAMTRLRRVSLLLIGGRGSFRRAFRVAHRDPELHLNFSLDAPEHLSIVFQCLLGVLPALAQTFAFVREPGATLLYHALHHCQVEQVTFARNAFAVHDVKLTFTKRRRDFVLRNFHFRTIAGHAIAVLDRADATNVEPQCRVKLERAAATGRLGTAEHNPDLLANLVD